MKIRTFITVLFSCIAIALVMPSGIEIDISGDGFPVRYVGAASFLPIAQEENEDAVLTPEPKVVVMFEPIADIVSDLEPVYDEIAEPTPEPEPEPTPEPEPEPDPIVTITVSAAGDTTLGGCVERITYSVFMRVFRENNEDMTYFLRNVRHIFMQDDLTLLNLECALTNETRHRGKTYNYKGEYRMAEVLSSSGVDAASLANNHTDDFFAKGYQDTKDALTEFGVAYFGNETNRIIEIKGIKVGLYGHLVWHDSREMRNKTKASIDDLKEKGAELIIGYFHWGVDRANVPSSQQRNHAHFAIDNGTDLILGAHPHVIQGIEEYKGKNIVYSLGNFAYGGHMNPEDKDTFIFQQTFTFDNGVLLEDNEINIIPAYVSSLRNTNNYQPMIAEGDEAERILGRIERFSAQIGR